MRTMAAAIAVLVVFVVSSASAVTVEEAVAYRKAADAGNTAAMVRLGNCYYKGQGLPLDRAEAVKWFAIDPKAIPVRKAFDWTAWQEGGEDETEEATKSESLDWEDGDDSPYPRRPYPYPDPNNPED